MSGYKCLLILCYLLLAIPCGIAGSADYGRQVVRGNTGEKLNAFLTFMAQMDFAGALIVSRKGEVLINKGYGYANVAERRPNDPNTAFDTGSITKQFTATAIMKLEMLGKLRTEDTLDRFFQRVPDDKKAIRIHHLLSHTSGIINYTGTHDHQKMSRDRMVKQALKAPLRHEIGSEYRYSNAGYSLLAAIVEIVSGKVYEEFVREQLFVPAGMMFTGYVRPDWEKVAVSHQYLDGLHNGTPLEKPYPFWNLLGNGGMLALPGDMLRWHDALSGHTILSETVKQKLYKPVLNDYAYGWRVRETSHGKVISHSGGNDFGASANFVRYMDRGIAVFYAQNLSSAGFPAFYLLRGGIERILFDSAFRVPVFPTISSPDIRQYSGRYQMENGGLLEVAARGKVLVINPLSQTALDLMSPGDAEMAMLSEKARSIVGELMMGGSTRLAASLTNPDSLARFREAFDRRRKSVGASARSRILGTTPSWWSDWKESATLISLEGKKGQVVFRFQWWEGKIRGLGGGAIPSPAMWFCFSDEQGRWLAFDPLYGRVTEIFWAGESGQRTLVLPGPRGTVRASRSL